MHDCLIEEEGPTPDASLQQECLHYNRNILSGMVSEVSGMDVEVFQYFQATRKLEKPDFQYFQDMRKL